MEEVYSTIKPATVDSWKTIPKICHTVILSQCYYADVLMSGSSEVSLVVSFHGCNHSLVNGLHKSHEWGGGLYGEATLEVSMQYEKEHCLAATLLSAVILFQESPIF
jgi:hypothetical protein